MTRPDAMCLEALRRGLILVDTEAGRAWSIRFHGKEVGCRSVRGYTVFTLHIDEQRAQIKLHRLIWLAANGPIPPGLIPDHRNRMKRDNRIANLRLVDSAENSRNRRSYAESGNPAAKINAVIAAEIRVTHSAERKYGAYPRLAKRYGVSKSLVGKIIRGEMWS